MLSQRRCTRLGAVLTALAVATVATVWGFLVLVFSDFSAFTRFDGECSTNSPTWNVLNACATVVGEVAMAWSVVRCLRAPHGKRLSASTVCATTAVLTLTVWFLVLALTQPASHDVAPYHCDS